MEQPSKELQIPALKQQLLDRTDCLAKELESLSMRLVNVKHPEPPATEDSEISKNIDRVPLAAELYIVLSRVNSSIGLVRTLLETMEI